MDDSRDKSPWPKCYLLEGTPCGVGLTREHRTLGVTEFSRVDLTWRFLVPLVAGEMWFTDEHIDAWFDLVTHSHNMLLPAPTAFDICALHGPVFGPNCIYESAMAKLSKVITLTLDQCQTLGQIQHVFFPFSWQGDHWMLLHYCFATQTAVLYNSYWAYAKATVAKLKEPWHAVEHGRSRKLDLETVSASQARARPTGY